MEFNFWDKEIETLPREEIEKLQLEALKKQIDKNPIFGAKMTTNGEVFQAFLANPKYL